MEPSGSPLRGTDGSEVASFTDQPVTGLKPRLVPPPTVDGQTLTLTFDEELDPGATPGNALFDVTVNGAPRNLARDGGIAIAGKTVRLTLRSAVAPGDTVMVRYTRPGGCQHCSWGLRGASHIAVDTFPDQAVTNRTGPPAFSSAAVNGTALTLTFDKDLDLGSRPAPDAFHVTVNNARRSVASGGVAISGKTVTLTLASAVSPGDTVKVRYTKPSSNPLRGADGRAVDTFARPGGDQQHPGNHLVGHADGERTSTLRASSCAATGCSNRSLAAVDFHKGNSAAFTLGVRRIGSRSIFQQAINDGSIGLGASI